MKKITLTKVFRSDKDKNGNLLKTKDGRGYTKIAIKAQEYGDKWLSGFDNKITCNWKEGDVVEVDVEQKGEYLNFKTVSEFQKLWLAIKEINTNLAEIRASNGMAAFGTDTEVKQVVEDNPFV